MMDAKYFSRCAAWHRAAAGGPLVAHDVTSPRAPRMLTLDAWAERVFAAADGRRTVGEFVAQLAAAYPRRPHRLQERVHQLVRMLADEGIVRLHDARAEPAAPTADERASAGRASPV